MRKRETGSEKQERPSPGCPSTWDSSVGDAKGFHSRDGKRKKMRGEQWEKPETLARRGLQSRGSAKRKTQEAIQSQQLQTFASSSSCTFMSEAEEQIRNKRVHQRKHLGLQTETQLLLIMFFKLRETHAAAAQNMIQTYRTGGISHVSGKEETFLQTAGQKFGIIRIYWMKALQGCLKIQ